jgi:dGTPase
VRALEEQPLTGPILAALRCEFPDLDRARTVHELLRRVIGAMVHDILVATAGRIEAAGIRTAADVGRAGHWLVGFSAEMAQAERELKRFLFQHVYRHEQVNRPVRAAEAVVVDLFRAYSEDPRRLPADWGRDLDARDTFRTARRVADYIAGMTDRYAVSEHTRLFDRTPELG